MSLAEKVNQIRSLAANGSGLVDIATAVGLEIGDVETVLASMPAGAPTSTALPTASKSRQTPVWDGTRWVADGATRIIACPFTYDMADLVTGHPLFSPQIGDLLFDCWVEVDTPWNSSNPGVVLPRADIGRFMDGYVNGWFEQMSGWSMRLDQVDATEAILDYGVLTASLTGSFNEDAPTSLYNAYLQGFVRINMSGTANAAGVPSGAPELLLARVVPAKFVTADPVRVCVSTTGHSNGASPGATQGSATAYFLIATPASG